MTYGTTIIASVQANLSPFARSGVDPHLMALPRISLPAPAVEDDQSAAMEPADGWDYLTWDEAPSEHDYLCRTAIKPVVTVDDPEYGCPWDEILYYRGDGQPEDIYANLDENGQNEFDLAGIESLADIDPTTLPVTISQGVVPYEVAPDGDVRSHPPEVESALTLDNWGIMAVPMPRGGDCPYPEPGGRERPDYTVQGLPRYDFPALFAGSNVGAVTGKKSGGLFVIRCGCDAADELQRLCADDGIPILMSDCAEGKQAWFRLRNGEVLSNPFALLHGDGTTYPVEIFSEDDIVVAPGSVDPVTGEILAWTPDSTSSDPVEVSLTGLDFIDFVVPTSERLPRIAHEVLFLHQGADRGREYRATLSLLGAGYAHERILDIFERYAPLQFDARGRDKFSETVLSWSNKRLNPVKKPEVPVYAAEQFRDLINVPKIKGTPSRNSLLSAIGAIVRIANRCRKAEFSLSVREIEIEANLSRDAAHRCITHLSKPDMMLISCGKDAVGANVFRLKVPQDTSATLSVRDDLLTGCESPLNDLWSHSRHGSRGLGKSPRFVYQELLSLGKASHRQITERVGIHPKTVLRALRLLAGHGLATKTDKTWTPVLKTEEEMSRIADRLGCLGRGEVKSAKIKQQREAYSSLKESERQNASQGRS